jgi:tetratricopeptide (TPR) repeat protein
MIKVPTNITYWITYFVSAYLAGNYDTSLEIFESIEELITQDDNKKDLKPCELNEIYLFKVHVLETMQEYKKGIKFMTKKTTDKIICDEIRKNEILARLYFKNNQNKKSIECLEILLSYNSSNKDYLKRILEASDAMGDE